MAYLQTWFIDDRITGILIRPRSILEKGGIRNSRQNWQESVVTLLFISRFWVLSSDSVHQVYLQHTGTPCLPSYAWAWSSLSYLYSVNCTQFPSCSLAFLSLLSSHQNTASSLYRTRWNMFQVQFSDNVLKKPP